MIRFPFPFGSCERFGMEWVLFSFPSHVQLHNHGLQLERFSVRTIVLANDPSLHPKSAVIFSSCLWGSLWNYVVPNRHPTRAVSKPLRERADRVSIGSGVPSLHRLLNRAHGGRSRERRTAGSARCCPRATRERSCKRGRTWIFFFGEQSVTHMDGRGPFLLSSFGPLAVNQGRAIHFSRLDLARYVSAASLLCLVWPISPV
jgi:hypothetical protein